jgi:hypothetical protein
MQLGEQQFCPDNQRLGNITCHRFREIAGNRLPHMARVKCLIGHILELLNKTIT